MGSLLHHAYRRIKVVGVALFFWQESGLHEKHARLKQQPLGMRSILTLSTQFLLCFLRMLIWLHNVVLRAPQESVEDFPEGQACSPVLCPFQTWTFLLLLDYLCRLEPAFWVDVELVLEPSQATVVACRNPLASAMLLSKPQEGFCHADGSFSGLHAHLSR